MYPSRSLPHLLTGLLLLIVFPCLVAQTPSQQLLFTYQQGKRPQVIDLNEHGIVVILDTARTDQDYDARGSRTLEVLHYDTSLQLIRQWTTYRPTNVFFRNHRLQGNRLHVLYHAQGERKEAQPFFVFSLDLMAETLSSAEGSFPEALESVRLCGHEQHIYVTGNTRGNKAALFAVNMPSGAVTSHLTATFKKFVRVFSMTAKDDYLYATVGNQTAKKKFDNYLYRFDKQGELESIDALDPPFPGVLGDCKLYPSGDELFVIGQMGRYVYYDPYTTRLKRKFGTFVFYRIQGTTIQTPTFIPYSELGLVDVTLDRLEFSNEQDYHDKLNKKTVTWAKDLAVLHPPIPQADGYLCILEMYRGRGVFNEQRELVFDGWESRSIIFASLDDSLQRVQERHRFKAPSYTRWSLYPAWISAMDQNKINLQRTSNTGKYLYWYQYNLDVPTKLKKERMVREDKKTDKRSKQAFQRRRFWYGNHVLDYGFLESERTRPKKGEPHRFFIRKAVFNVQNE
ncbi:MAG: hypothetical protein F6K11_07640 [Leptolyngbya sp. SIO3F4]|nr:hypothetical protein [Leptolyngbya sp. SIO3F4]